jgi:diguanylate cyclase (GGDEF)-like protein
MIILDLDDFKQLNDAQGHEAGDQLLEWVAATLRAGLGPDDVIARLGGDEFVVLTAGGDGEATAARIAAALAERTAVSYGTTTVSHDGTTFATLYSAADRRMYRQKQSRRQIGGLR